MNCQDDMEREKAEGEKAHENHCYSEYKSDGLGPRYGTADLGHDMGDGAAALLLNTYRDAGGTSKAA